MRVLFCNIAWMKYYNGVRSGDEPVNGGSWVNENQSGAEIYNFTEYDDGNYHGYVTTKSNRGRENQLHIERLDGVDNNAEEAENVLVIWVACDPAKGKNYIVGWYKNATVCRYYYYDGDEWPKNIYAKIEDCILLPTDKRHKIVPRAGHDGYSYGMGSANVWFAQNDDERCKKYVQNMIDYINSYDGENAALKG